MKEQIKSDNMNRPFGRIYSFLAAICFATEALAYGLATANADFVSMEGTDGWSVSGGSYASPQFEGDISSVSVTCTNAQGAVSVSASADMRSSFGSFNASIITNAQWTFAEGSSIRQLYLFASNNLTAVQITYREEAPGPKLCIAALSILDCGYTQNFDIFGNWGWDHSTNVWADGVTLPGWQATMNGKIPEKITKKSGKGGSSAQTAGLYAYYSTNKTVTASSYSLAAVSNTQTENIFGFALKNDTQNLLYDFSLSMTMRQWTFSSKRTAAQTFKAYCLVTNEYVSVAADGDWQEIATMNAVPSLEEAETGTEADYVTGSVRLNVEDDNLGGVQLKPGEMLFIKFVPQGVSSGEVFGVDDFELTFSHRTAQGLAISIAQNSDRSYH